MQSHGELTNEQATSTFLLSFFNISVLHENILFVIIAHPIRNDYTQCNTNIKEVSVSNVVSQSCSSIIINIRFFRLVLLWNIKHLIVHTKQG